MVHARPMTFQHCDNSLAIALMGPTATGKTGLAMQLVDHFPQLEIVSVDSTLVYRGLDIGSAKPDKETLKRYPHHLIDIREPDAPYSASDFREDALRTMRTIWGKGKVPLLVGGTMLYFKVLSDGIAVLPQADAAIRASLNARALESGWPALHEELRRVDPEAARRIHPNDSQRLQRALEVFALTGRPLSELQAEQAVKVNNSGGSDAFSLVSLALMTDNRPELHQRIEQRFRLMLEQGLIEEVKGLKQKFVNANLPAMRAVGYRQVWHYLEGDYDRDDMVRKAVAATRQLAKRQITWLRSWPELRCFDMEAPDLSNQVIKKVSDLLENGEPRPN